MTQVAGEGADNIRDMASSIRGRGGLEALQPALATLVGALVDESPLATFVLDAAGRYAWANRAMADLVGRPPAELVACTLADTTHPREVELEVARLRRVLDGAPSLIREKRYVRPGGEVVAARVSWRRATDGSGNVWVVGHAEPLPEPTAATRQPAELLVRAQRRVLGLIAADAPLAETLGAIVELVEQQEPACTASVLLLDDDGQTLRHGAAPRLPHTYVDAIDGTRIGPAVGSCGTAAYRREAVIVDDIRTDPLWADYRDLAAAHGLRACWSIPVCSSEDQRVLGTFALYYGEPRRPTGDERALLDAAAHLAEIAITRARARDRLLHQALHDPLTGLPNRTLFLDRLAVALGRAAREDRTVAVLYLDLDRFKVVNDSLGHAAGDELLVGLAARLVAAVRPGDTVARFGGDEFTVLCEVTGEADATAIAERLADATCEPLPLRGEEVVLTASIGIALAPADADPEALLRDADAAANRAKDRGRSRHVLFDEGLRDRVVERLRVEHDLRRALERDELCLHYQPEVCLETGRVHAVEALVRWNHPTRGLVGPVQFLSTAEETGLIVRLGEWVLREACRQAAAWRDELGELAPVVWVNIAARQLSRPGLAEAVEQALAGAGLTPDRLCLEITESTLADDLDGALDVLHAVRRLGVRLAVDDFGTGYSSLLQLRRFPVDFLKIDRSFVDGIDRNSRDAAIVRAVIDLSRTLGLTTVAEGVERPTQVSALRAMGCEMAQGYWLALPQPGPSLTAALATGHVRASGAGSR